MDLSPARMRHCTEYNQSGSTGKRASALDARCLSALVRHRQGLVEGISISNIIHDLKGIVSQQEYETLSLPTFTNQQKVQCLIDLLSNGSQEQFNSFVEVLREHGSELANSLNNYECQAGEQQWSDAFVCQLLVKGEVEFFSKITARPEKLELIRSALRSVQSGQPHPLRVLLVHGMGGSGKTVLASEAVRCAPLVAECFPNGIIWKSAGHMRGLEGAELERAIQELFIKILTHPQLKSTWRLDQHKLEGMKVDQLGIEINHVVINMHLLLVLDDVWQQDVLAALKNVSILVLVTSRSTAIADGLSAHVEYVEAMKCTMQEAKGIVTSHCGPVDEEAMETMMIRCNGLPLALAIMAAVLKDKPPHEQREIARAPNKAKYLEAEFQYLSSRPLPLNYECLNDVLEASILELKKEIKEKKKRSTLQMLAGTDLRNLYLDIAVVDDDEVIFASKLDSVWKQSPELTRRLLDVLADRNLLTRTGRKSGDDEPWKNHGDEKEREDLFTIHDVQLDFLRELVIWEEGSLNVRYRRWISGFLLKNSHLNLLALWEHSDELRGMEELWRIVRTFKEGIEWWQQCTELIVNLNLIELPLMQSELFKLLLSSVSPREGWTIVHQATLEGLVNTKSLPPLLQAFPSLNIHAATTDVTLYWRYRFESGTVLLHVAAASGKKDVVDYLIQKHQCDPNQKNNDNWTPLHYGSKHGSVEVVNALLHHKADIEARNSDNSTPLHVASQYGHVEVVKALLDHEADIEAKDKNNSTSLHVASQYVGGHVEVVNALLDYKADIEAKTKDNWTPLYWASRNGNVDVVRVLVQRGANVNAKDGCEQTPKDVVCTWPFAGKSQSDTIRRLLDE